MQLEVLVEEPSAEVFLDHVLPRLLPAEATYRIHPHQGKLDLLAKLEGRLRGYASWIKQRSDVWIVVLVDEDRQDCKAIKATLEKAAKRAGLVSRGAARAGKRFHVLNRIAVEELESWLLGDPDAVLAAYPKVNASFHKRANYRDPDAVNGGTWEAFERLLQRAGYYAAGLQKQKAARDVALHVEPSRNRSPSFRAFCSGIQLIVEQAGRNGSSARGTP